MYKLTTLEAVQELLDEQVVCNFDTETDGFYGKIEVAQFYQKHWQDVLLVQKPDIYELIGLLTKQPLRMQNGHYDITTIQQQSGTSWIPDSWQDTFYASRLFFYTKDSFSFDDILTYVVKEDVYKNAGLDKKALQKSDWAGVLTEDQKLYAAFDAYYMEEVWDKVGSAAEEFNYKLDMHFTRECLKFQCNGMPVNSELLDKRFTDNEEQIKTMAMTINVNSWQQVRPYIGEEQSDALALTTFKLRGNKRAGEVLKTRRIIKENSFLKKFDSTSGRIYGKFLPSARSGRCTSKDQNLQQLPRKTKVVFGTAVDSGRVLTYSDYAQLELRCACVITKETRMEQLFREGKDLHTYTAIMLFGENFTPEQRQIAKTCNFNLLYGGGHEMLGSILVKDAEILLPESELREYKSKWQKLWPTIVAWQQSGIKAWRNKVAWQTPLGRKYTAKMMTDQLNLQVQGFGAEVAKLATHYMTPRVAELNSEYMYDPYKFGAPEDHTPQPILLCNFVHDSWVFENDKIEGLYVRLAKVIASSMQEAWVEASRSTKIKDLPMPVEVFTGHNWGNIEKDYLHHYEIS